MFCEIFALFDSGEKIVFRAQTKRVTNVLNNSCMLLVHTIGVVKIYSHKS